VRSFLLSIALLTTPLIAEDYQPKDYSYLLGMKGFDDALLKLHFQLYQGYVKQVNLLSDALKKFPNSTPLDTYEFGALKRRFGWEFDGMRLHELYFDNLGGKGSLPNPKSSFMESVTTQFGSFGQWKQDFVATALMRGIGWVILYREKQTDRLFNAWIDQHDVGHLATLKPIIVLDVWEHAYLTQYGLNRADYVEAFMNNINWAVVDQRLKQL